MKTSWMKLLIITVCHNVIIGLILNNDAKPKHSTERTGFYRH